jgi:lysozyme family protein
MAGVAARMAGIAMSFPNALVMLLDLEGGYQTSDLADDSGFATCAGITHVTWIDYSMRKSIAPHWPPTREEIGSFYQTEYWKARQCSELPDQTAAVWLQCAVNLPFGEGNQVLQAALNVWPDGIIGSQTLAAISGRQAADLSDAILTAQLQHYIDKRGVLDPLFRGLWDRVQSVRQYITNGLI